MSEVVDVQAPVENGRRWTALRDVAIGVAVVGVIWLGLRVLRDQDAFSGMGPLTGKLLQALLAIVLGIGGIWALFIVVNSLVEHLPARAAEMIRPWVFVLPALAVVGVYLVYPAVRTIIQSFTEIPEGGGALSNYTDAFTDPAVQVAMRNNVIWLLVAPAAAVAIGLAFAALADRVKHESLAKTFVFVPLAISMVGASVIWKFVYEWRVPGQPQVGIINAVIQFFGGEPIPFLFEIPINTFAMIVIMIWLQVGFAMVILSAAIKGVPVTTPEAIDLQATFRRMLNGGDRACSMEVSSHALELGRAAGIHFACRVFTNLTQDHLDFHETMEAYFLSKRRLFDQAGPAVVNVDDDYGRRLASEVDCVTFAIDREADYRARDVEFDLMGSRFRCQTPEGELELFLPLPGLFNVQNALGAVAVARQLGIGAETIAAALAHFGRVPGRFEPVDEGQDFGVLVDYAHTPDSLENVLRAARELARGRVHVVFGAGGDRDRGKRPLMGDAARRLADRVLVTSDNPRSEPPEAIVDEIMEGAGPGAERESDRGRAIAVAIQDAEAGDVVVIAGKGHEQGQEFENGRKEPFDDREVAREALLRRKAPR